MISSTPPKAPRFNEFACIEDEETFIDPSEQTAIQAFVRENEPAAQADEDLFNRQLQDAVDEVYAARQPEIDALKARIAALEQNSKRWWMINDHWVSCHMKFDKKTQATLSMNLKIDFTKVSNFSPEKLASAIDSALKGQA